MYVGLSQTIIAYKGTQLSKSFAEVAAVHDIGVGSSGTEAHNSIGVE